VSIIANTLFLLPVSTAALRYVDIPVTTSMRQNCSIWSVFHFACAAAAPGAGLFFVVSMQDLLMLLVDCSAIDSTGEQATVWTFNFFFYNKKMKRILYIGVKAFTKSAADDEDKVRQGTSLMCCSCSLSCRTKDMKQMPAASSELLLLKDLLLKLLLLGLLPLLQHVVTACQDDEDSKYIYNSDDEEGEADYGMANTMDI
jgi:hypothetical protein